MERESVILPELHIWSTGTAGCEIEVRRTQPNRIRPRAEMQANGRYFRLDAVAQNADSHAISLSGTQMRQLAVSPPNWSGNFLAIDILHTLDDVNELRYWGWSYRLLRGGIPLARAANADGAPLSLDAQGWLIWPRQRRDFGDIVCLLDHITLEMRA